MRISRALVAAALLMAAQTATAAELKVFSTIGVQAALEELTPSSSRPADTSSSSPGAPPRCW